MKKNPLVIYPKKGEEVISFEERKKQWPLVSKANIYKLSEQQKQLRIRIKQKYQINQKQKEHDIEGKEIKANSLT